MIRYRARWIVPVAGSPIRDGWVTVDGDRIVALGHGQTDDSAATEDLGAVAILPGLVNAHTHLELSYLRQQIAPSASFTAWVRQILHARRQRQQQSLRDPAVLTAIDTAIDESLRSGTAVVGEITNTLVTFEKLARSPLAGVVFWEQIGFRFDKPEAVIEFAMSELATLPASDRMRASLAAHAPYSVAPLLFRSIKDAVSKLSSVPHSVHLAENVEEVELLKTGAGPWKTIMKELGSWDEEWSAPGVGPVQYLDEMGFIDERLLIVHGVQMTESDMSRIAARRATIVTCPRSNEYTGAGTPPIEAFYQSGARVAVGTDSLASSPDLSVFKELAAMRAIAPSIPAPVLLDSATRQGARALGFPEYGSIEAGQRARLIAVSVPPGVSDVEEYLVSGIETEQIRWIS